MRKKFQNLFYFLFVVVFSGIIYYIISAGKNLEIGRNVFVPKNDSDQWGEFLKTLSHNLSHPLSVLLLQIVIIIVLVRIVSWFFKLIGQPSVIGEILAGILLGPSFFGAFFPELFASLFPISSLNNLQFLSQIGLILFMFIIGMELDFSVLKTKAHDALVISHASILVPFTLGISLAYYIFDTYTNEGVQFLSFGLFMGISMSITAFPVLARIVHERGLHKTKLGTMVITCAAIDDITAWGLLAAVVAIVRAGSFVSSLYIMFLALIYVLVMTLVIMPLLNKVNSLYSSKEQITKPIVAVIFIIILLSSYTTELIGVHALFGAFMAGTIMPNNEKFKHAFVEKIEDVAILLLLPLFFVFTGLRTEIGLLNTVELWKMTGLIIVVAVVGKFLGSALVAKFVGQTWKDSLSIGALMNTRGLMELVVLNIGYDLGILSPEVFAMMVIMALVTTFMTGPALNLINFLFRK